MKDKFEPKSSYLELASWDSETETMTLTFKNGTQYNYLDVFEATWLNFKQAADHGVYYSRAIKGRIQSVPVRQTVVGKPKSSPLKKLRLNRSLKSYGITDNALKRADRISKQFGNIPPGLR